MKLIPKKHNNHFFSIFIGSIFIFFFLCSAYLYGRSSSSKSVSTLREKHDMVIQYETNTAISLLDSLYQKHLKGELTLEEAKLMGADLLRNLRYGPAYDGYFWADTTDGVNVFLYGDKNIEGTNRWDAFIGGTYYVREIIKNGMKEEGGYTNYYFPKKGDTIPIQKRAYSILFSPFNWVIGTGYYPADISQ